jgi:ubiquinone biosynthesis protein
MIGLFATARRFNMEIQPQLMLLQKTLFNIEGLGRQLYPELDLWKTAHPILRQWMDEQVGGRAFVNSLREDLPQLRDAMRELPGVIKYLSEQITQGDLQLNVRSPELKQIREQLRDQQKQRYLLALGATAALSGTLVLTLGSTAVLGWALIAVGVAAAIGGRPA